MASNFLESIYNIEALILVHYFKDLIIKLEGVLKQSFVMTINKEQPDV